MNKKPARRFVIANKDYMCWLRERAGGWAFCEPLSQQEATQECDAESEQVCDIILRPDLTKKARKR